MGPLLLAAHYPRVDSPCIAAIRHPFSKLPLDTYLENSTPAVLSPRLSIATTGPIRCAPHILFLQHETWRRVRIHLSLLTLQQNVPQEQPLHDSRHAFYSPRERCEPMSRLLKQRRSPRENSPDKPKSEVLLSIH